MSVADPGGYRWMERGKGEVILLLHGLMGEAEHWCRSLEALASRYRTLALRLPILDAGNPAVSPAELAEYVRGFLDAAGIGRVVAGGNSLGGHVALELTLRHPGRVSALVLTGSSGLFERSFTRGVPHRPTPEWVRAKMEEIFFDPACVTAEWVEAVHRAVTRRDSALRILQTARAAKRSSLGERLPRIAAPTCLIWGEEDQITPPEVARLFADRIPGSDLHLIPRCGHAPMLEQPEAFNCILGAWLERTDAARRARQVLAEAA